MSVSIVIPAYNASRYIEACFRSIADQDYLPSEVIIIDDASLDDTRAQVQRCRAILPCPVIVCSNTVNRGNSISRNRGISLSSFPWLAFLDVDDKWEPNHLKSLIIRLRETQASFVYSGVRVIDYETGNELDGGYDIPPAQAMIPHSFYGQNFIMPSQVMVRRSINPGFVWFNPKYTIASDADCWLSLYHLGATFAYTGLQTCLYQKSPHSLSSDSLKRCIAFARRMSDYERLGDFPIPILRKKARDYWYAAARICWRCNPIAASKFLLYSLISNILSLIPPHSWAR